MATLGPDKVIASLHAGTFSTVLGDIAFDAKGDVSGANFVWYVWRDGRYIPTD